VREASAALDTLPDWAGFDALLLGLPSPTEAPLTQADITHTIATERRQRNVPRFRVEKAPRQPRKAKSPRRRLPWNLFEDLFSLLEGKL
jgi:hypothetical protein